MQLPNHTMSMRIAFDYCEHAIAARFDKFSEDEMSCLLKKLKWKNKKSFISK